MSSLSRQTATPWCPLKLDRSWQETELDVNRVDTNILSGGISLPNSQVASQLFLEGIESFLSHYYFCPHKYFNSINKLVNIAMNTLNGILTKVGTKGTSWKESGSNLILSACESSDNEKKCLSVLGMGLHLRSASVHAYKSPLLLTHISFLRSLLLAHISFLRSLMRL